MNKLERFNGIVAIFGHENLFFSMGQGEDILAYYVHAIFNTEGLIETPEFLQFIFDNVLSADQKRVYRKTGLFGPFHVFAEFESFCIKLAQFHKEDEIAVISTTEFNEVVQLAQGIDDLYSGILERCRHIELDEQQKKRSFFSNLFR